MLIYRFRITSEEHDGFLREIEIQPNQTFQDFHHILIDSSELLHCERASFFMTDKRFRKDKEICLKAEKRQVRRYDEDLDQVVTESVSVPMMKSSKVKDYIEDPHQRMIYEFEGRDHFTFHIELFKVCHAEGMESYPLCSKRAGELPKKAEQPVAAPPQPQPAPKPSLPKVTLPKPEKLAALDDIVEDEQELAAIESELEGLLAEDESNTFDEQPAAESPAEEEMAFGEQDEEFGDHDDDHMEHLEDFEDIENLDKRLNRFDRESDDY